jgi:TetR/AcrR family transcriptional repressor of nem operon
MRYEAGHKERTRGRVVVAAARLFKERGFRGVGVDGVMGAEGLTAGGFYAHFPSKEALLEATLSSYRLPIQSPSGQAEDAFRKPGSGSAAQA